MLEYINANSVAHEYWHCECGELGRDASMTTLVTFAPGQSQPEH